MTLAKLDQIFDRIARENKKIWRSEPEDIERLDKRKGTYNCRYPPVYVAAGATNTTGSVMYILREASKKEEVDLKSLKVLTKSVLDSNVAIAEWLSMNDLSHLLADASLAVSEIESKDSFRDFIGQLILYVKKMSCWIEYMMPFSQISELYEYVQPQRHK